MQSLRDPAIFAPDSPLRDVAARLAGSAGADAAAVTGGNGVLGLITRRMLSDRVASGELSLDAPARLLMQPVHTVAVPGQEGWCPI